MALNIPLPMDAGEAFSRGVDSGSNLFSRIMQPRLEREKQAQLEKHFQEELKLRKAAAGRAGANSDLQRKMMELQLHKLEQEIDPMKKIAYINSLLEGVRGMHGGQKPQEENIMGMFTGQGMPSAEEIERPTVKAPSMEEIQRGFGNFSPEEQMALGMAGIKLPTVRETPAERRAAALQDKIEFEKYKSSQGEKLPAAVKTLHENIINLSPRASKAIQHLIDIPSPFEPFGFGAIQSGKKAAHNKAVSAAAETYAKAKGWPNTKGSIMEAKSILERGHLESDSDYRKRLKGYQDELEEGVRSSRQYLHPGEKGSSSEEPVIEYVRVNGRLVPKGAR